MTVPPESPDGFRTEQGFETTALHAGQEPDPLIGAVVPPIYQVSIYKQDGVGVLRGGYEYSRSANPTRTALEECLAAIEGGRRGLAFASGLAAEDTLLRTVCQPGDHVVIPGDAYGGSYRLFASVLARWGLDFTPSPGHDVDAVRAALRPGRTKVIWCETPTNPLLGISDIAALAAAVGVEALRRRAPQDGPLARSQRVSNRRLREASGWAPRTRAGTETWGRIAA